MNNMLRRSIVCVFILVMIVSPLQASAQKLSAGDVDDNLNYKLYLSYNDHITKNNSQLPSLGVQDRVTIKVLDASAAGVSNALVKITVNGQTSPLISSRTGTDGLFQFFPKHDGALSSTSFTINVSAPDGQGPYAETNLDLNNIAPSRLVTLTIPGYKTSLPTSVDLAFVIDCTGSMSDELTYLTSEFSNIVAKVSADHPNATMRYGLVVYRDEGDDYVVKEFPFTDSLQLMQSQLSSQTANGGGDYEEAVHKALSSGVNTLEWRGGNTLRLLFHVADAPPHNNYLDDTISAVDVARAKGIHIFPLAGSGVADIAEYMMRAEALLTGGRYMFLTDDSGIGNKHKDPHVPCYIVTNLDNLIVRVVESQLTGTRVEPSSASIIKTVGNYTKGVCLVQDPGSPSTPPPSVLAAGGLRTDGGPLSAMPSMTFPMVCAAVLAIIGIKVATKRLREEQ